MAEKPLFAFFKEKASSSLFTITSYSWPHCFLSNSTAISQVRQHQLHPGNLGLSRGSFTPSGVHLLIPSMPEKPAGEINLQGGKNPNLWHPWAIKLRGMHSLLAQEMILTGMSAWTKGWWVFHWHGREEMDQIHQWNQLKKNQNSNKQTNMARKLKGNKRESWCMSWHNTKISERTEKWFFRYGLPGGNLCLHRPLFQDLLGWASVPRRRFS